MAPHRISTGQTSMTAASSALHQAKPKDHSTAAAITTARIGHNHIQRLANSGHRHCRRARLSSAELTITDSEDSAIAAAAMIGLSSPKAAIGTPIAL